MKQFNSIMAFSKNANYYMISFKADEEEFGKILTGNELKSIDLSENEIYRSIEEQNGNKLFVYNLKPIEPMYVSNPIQLLLHTLEDARTIEMTYPNIFTWVFNGLNMVAYATIPSGSINSNSTITRYGGTENFIKILRHHLSNIIKIKNGITPNYDFSSITEEVKKEELSIGSINKLTDLFSICVPVTMKYNTILKNSRKGISTLFNHNILDMKYWAREINPDFIHEAKHIKLKDTISIDDGFKLYPAPIIRIMALPHKGNYNRYLLARFLLSIHSPKDAKFIFYSVLGNDERIHVKTGNCATQWRYIRNNMERYTCPSMKELSQFIEEGDEKLSHPLEGIQKYLDDEQKRINSGTKSS